MLEFSDLTFSEANDKVRVTLYNLFYKEFSKEELKNEMLKNESGNLKIQKGKLSIASYSDDRTEKTFMRFFRKFKKDLIYLLNGNKAVYVDEDMSLPLIGLQFLGIVDKGSEMIEVKPITNCNAACIFCSVNEGINSDKKVDFVVDKEYLVQQLFSLLNFKKSENMSIWINPHGEPTLYAKLPELVEEIAANKYVAEVHIVTNAILLSNKLADSFAAAASNTGKKICVSISISSLSHAMANKLMGNAYNYERVLEDMCYAMKKLPVILTPVYLKGINDDEIKQLVLLTKKFETQYSEIPNHITISIQKFCSNKRGNNPIKEQPWDDFFKQLKTWENETAMSLSTKLGKLNKTIELPMVCKKGEKVSIRIICQGRYPNEHIGVIETKQGSRATGIIGANASSGAVKARVLECKNNIYLVKI